MKHRFNKDELPFLTNALHQGGSPRDMYWLGRRQGEQKFYTLQSNRELMIYQEAAYRGDDWAMHELGKRLASDDRRFPEGIMWLRKSLSLGNKGAEQEIRSRWSEFYQRIFKYDPKENEPYGNLEVRSALIADHCLTRFGLENWDRLSRGEKDKHVLDLAYNICILLGIRQTKIELVDTLSLPGMPVVDGLAYIGQDRIQFRRGVFDNLERTIQVIFHEFGHIVEGYMCDTRFPGRAALLKLFGLDEAHVHKWWDNPQNGYAIPLKEEDPDTYSYGVWWTYVFLFQSR